jgi:hypothetical protein
LYPESGISSKYKLIITSHVNARQRQCWKKKSLHYRNDLPSLALRIENTGPWGISKRKLPWVQDSNFMLSTWLEKPKEKDKFKVVRLPLGTMRLTPVIPATWEADWEDRSLRPAQANSSQDPISKINHSKMDCRCDSGTREPALEVQSPEFKSQSHQNRKKKV